MKIENLYKVMLFTMVFIAMTAAMVMAANGLTSPTVNSDLDNGECKTLTMIETYKYVFNNQYHITFDNIDPAKNRFKEYRYMDGSVLLLERAEEKRHEWIYIKDLAVTSSVVGYDQYSIEYNRLISKYTTEGSMEFDGVNVKVCYNNQNQISESLSCGDSGGDDGLYSACEDDTIYHNSGLKIKVITIGNDLVVNTGSSTMIFGKVGDTITTTHSGKEYDVTWTKNDDTRVNLRIKSKLIHSELSDESDDEDSDGLFCGNSAGGDGTYVICQGSKVRHDSGMILETITAREDRLFLAYGTGGMLFSNVGTTLKSVHNGKEYYVTFKSFDKKSEIGRITISSTNPEDNHVSVNVNDYGEDNNEVDDYSTDYGCYEVDRSNNLRVQGYVNFDGNTYYDTCVNRGTVRQYSCAAGGYGHSNERCETGYSCYAGECVINSKYNTLVNQYGEEDYGANMNSNSRSSTSVVDACEGCINEETCINVGIRFQEQNQQSYCGLDGKIKLQLEVGEECQNNFECLSNQCSNGQCIDIGKELQEQRGILEAISRFFRSIFS